MVNEMLSHDAFKLTGDTKSDLEKVYIQQYIHYIMSPLDQFINVRRSGIPMKNSTLLPWEEFSDLLDYSTLIPRRFKVSEPAPTDHDKLNSQRVWVDEGNPQFGEGPNLN